MFPNSLLQATFQQQQQQQQPTASGSASASSSVSSGSPQQAQLQAAASQHPQQQQQTHETKPSAADLLLAAQAQQNVAATVAAAALQQHLGGGQQSPTMTAAGLGGQPATGQREPKPFKCVQCPKAFANNSYLSQHMRIHLGIRAFGPCQFCGKKFTQLSHLQQHIRTHTGEKPYKCKFANCEKAFSQLSNLQSHSRCHQADRPFKCNSCYKCFADEQTLLEHIPRHKESKHLKASAKVHICPFCGKSYSQALYLDKHMTKHTDRRNDMRFPAKGYYANGTTTGSANGLLDAFDPFDGLHLGGQQQTAQNGTADQQQHEFTLKHFQMAASAMQQQQQQQQLPSSVSSVAETAAALSSAAVLSTNSALAASYGVYGAASANPFGGASAGTVSNGIGGGGGGGGPMATANVVNQMAIGNSALNFFQRSFQQQQQNGGAVGTRGFNMITPLENIKHFSSQQQQQGGGQQQQATANFH